jgi:uncharacterized protein (DUF305 family)
MERPHPARFAVPRRLIVQLGFATCLVLSHTPVVMADAPAPERHVAKFEVRFMEMMIDHHAMATEMATLCLTKATRSELGDLCQTMIEDQQSEIAMMQSWLSDWYGITHEPKMDARDRRQLEKLAALEGPSFDIEFMTMMIGHHWTAIQRSMQCVGRATHDELEQLCETMIKTQLDEIFQMRQWLCDWYGLCEVRIDGEVHGPHAS